MHDWTVTFSGSLTSYKAFDTHVNGSLTDPALPGQQGKNG
jgi:hypothetical protein